MTSLHELKIYRGGLHPDGIERVDGKPNENFCLNPDETFGFIVLRGGLDPEGMSEVNSESFYAVGDFEELDEDVTFEDGIIVTFPDKAVESITTLKATADSVFYLHPEVAARDKKTRENPIFQPYDIKVVGPIPLFPTSRLR